MVLRDQPEVWLLADLRIALMVDARHLDLGTAEIGQAGARRERHRLANSGCAVLTISTPSSIASLADWPALAELPVSGKVRRS